MGFPSSESFRNRPVTGSWGQEHAVSFQNIHRFLFQARLQGPGTLSEEKQGPITNDVTHDLLGSRFHGPGHERGFPRIPSHTYSPHSMFSSLSLLPKKRGGKKPIVYPPPGRWVNAQSHLLPVARSVASCSSPQMDPAPSVPSLSTIY